MINKKIALSLLSIAAALTVTGGAAYAAFSDTGSSTNNVFSTGSLDLQLQDNDETFTDNVTASFGQTNMVPGGTPVSGTLQLKNNGTVNSTDLDIVVTNVVSQAVSGPGTVSTEAMDKFLKIEVLTLNGVDKLAGLSDSNSNGIKDLDDLETQGLLNQPGISAGNSINLVMDVRLDTSTPNELQGDSVATAFAVTMGQ